MRLPATVGRSPDSALRLDDPAVSRMHCIFTLEDGVLTVTDLGSGSGTLVNGESAQRAALRPLDQIQVGETRLVVQ